MEIFHRTNTIDADLGKLSLVELMNLPKKNRFDLGGAYLNETLHPNHVQIAVIQDRSYTSGIHDFEYIVERRQIRLYSRYKKSAFLLYAYLAMPLLPIFLININNDVETITKLLIISVVTFIFLSLLLIVGIKSESKEMERKLLIRLNLLNQKGKKNIIL